MAGSLFNRLSLEEAGSLNSLESPGGERERERERERTEAGHIYLLITVRINCGAFFISPLWVH